MVFCYILLCFAGTSTKHLPFLTIFNPFLVWSTFHPLNPWRVKISQKTQANTSDVHLWRILSPKKHQTQESFKWSYVWPPIAMAEQKSLACYYCGVSFSKGPPSFVSRTSWAILVTLASTKMIRKSWPWSTRHEWRNIRDRLWDPSHGPGKGEIIHRDAHVPNWGGAIRRWFPPTGGWEGWGFGLGLVEFEDVSVGIFLGTMLVSISGGWLK